MLVHRYSIVSPIAEKNTTSMEQGGRPITIDHGRPRIADCICQCGNILIHISTNLDYAVISR